MKTIETMIETQIKKIKYDITAKGTIKEVLTDNKYKVGILGSEYTIKYTEKILRKYDTVYVLIPQKNYNEMFILSTCNNQANNQINTQSLSDLNDIITNMSNEIDKLKQEIETLKNKN